LKSSQTCCSSSSCSRQCAAAAFMAKRSNEAQSYLGSRKYLKPSQVSRELRDVWSARPKNRRVASSRRPSTIRCSSCRSSRCHCPDLLICRWWSRRRPP
jgi:hypothetical protein